MERPYWKHEEELLETRSITDFADIKDHAMKLFSDASFLCFAHGNINQEQVLLPYDTVHVSQFYLTQAISQ